MSRFVSRHPWLTLALVVGVCCFLFGPGTVGAWIGTHGRAAIVGAFHFVRALLAGAF